MVLFGLIVLMVWNNHGQVLHCVHRLSPWLLHTIITIKMISSIFSFLGADGGGGHKSEKSMASIMQRL